MENMFTIVGISGSLRTGSYNSALLKTAATLVPGDVALNIISLADVPMFNQDNESSLPSAVQILKDAVEKADAVLFVTPEYNYSVSGVLKNAIDWLSRPSGKNSLNDKPVGIMGASMGMFGSARAQYHLRQMMVTLNAHVLNKPEVMVASAQEKFDAQGVLTDAKTSEKVKEHLAALVEWAKRLKSH